MTKNEILNIIYPLRRSSSAHHWTVAKGKIEKLSGRNLALALEGLDRYINNCKRSDIELDANTFIEILDDAKQGVQVWKLDDLSQVPLIRRNGKVATRR